MDFKEIKNIPLKPKYLPIWLAKKYVKDEVGRSAAATTYYMIFSFFPLLIITSIFIGSIGIDTSWLEGAVSNIVPKSIAGLAKSYLGYASSYGSNSILLVSIFFTIYFPIRFIDNLMMSINKAYKAVNTRNIFKRYAMTIMFVFIVYVMMFSGFITVIIGETLFYNIMSLFHIPLDIIEFWQDTRYIIFYAVAFTSILLLYYIAPCVKQQFKDIFFGTIIASVTWIIVSLVFSYYAEHFAVYSALYGSIAVIMMLLYYLFITSLILIMGAELNSLIYLMRRKNKSVKKT